MHRSSWVASVALLLVISLSVSCASWHQISASPTLRATRPTYDQLRVELVGGTRVALRHAQFTADTLRGKPELLTKSLRERLTKEGATILPDKSVGVPVVLIRKVDKRGFSAPRTIGIVLGVGAVAVLVAVYIALATNGIEFGGL